MKALLERLQELGYRAELLKIIAPHESQSTL
jgi:hypothetical protein